MVKDGDSKSIPGSIEEITKRILLWAERKKPVLLRVEYVDELSRQKVENNLKAELQTHGIPVHEIDLTETPANILGQSLIEQLSELDAGVASIHGFAVALPDKDPELQHTLYDLNLRRESFASMPLCQIWWMPQHVAELFVGRIADLNSWFRLRAFLTESSRTSDDMLLSQTHRDQAISYQIRRVDDDVKINQETPKSESAETNVLSWPDKAKGKNSKPVLTTWQMTWEKLDVVEQALMALCSFYAPEDIPVDLFENQHETLQETVTLLHGAGAADKIDFQEIDPRFSLIELADWSMIKLKGDFFSLHRLVQDALRLRFDQQQKQLCQLSLNLINDNIPDYPPPQDVRSWPLWQKLTEHLHAAIDFADSHGITEPTSRLMNELALYHNARAEFVQAEPLYKRALQIDEKSLGSDHPDVAIRLNNLASFLQATNRLDEAEPLMRRALQIDENSFGSDHPNVARDLNNLAQLLQKTNRLDEAEPLMRRALQINENSFGSDHPKVALRLGNLAQLLQETNRFDEAEPLMRRALDIFRASFGEDHPNTQTVQQNLESLLAEMGGDKG